MSECNAFFALCEHGCVCGVVPCPCVGQMEALPQVWAEEWHVQGQGVRGRSQAVAAGLQSSCGGAGVVRPSRGTRGIILRCTARLMHGYLGGGDTVMSWVSIGILSCCRRVGGQLWPSRCENRVIKRCT